VFHSPHAFKKQRIHQEQLLVQGSSQIFTENVKLLFQLQSLFARLQKGTNFFIVVIRGVEIPKNIRRVSERGANDRNAETSEDGLAYPMDMSFFECDSKGTDLPCSISPKSPTLTCSSYSTSMKSITHRTWEKGHCQNCAIFRNCFLPPSLHNGRHEWSLI
jgi:hypothetical protein